LKLESLGYTVVGVDEFYTSKKCPFCQDFVGYVNIHRLYCPRCRKIFHRDIMAAENIAVAAKTWLIDFKRPEYLERPLQTTRKKRAASENSSSAKRAHV
jgi:transposase